MNMRRFKLRTGRSQVYDLTRENYRELTKKKSIYTGYGQDGQIRNFAVCPVCDNPIQIIGLYKQAKNTPDPYGKHYSKSIPLAKYNAIKYQFCPYASHTYVLNKEALKEEITDVELELYDTMRDYFDQVIYVLEKVMGIQITYKMAKKMLMEYRGNRGYLYYGAHIYNLPWMLLYFSLSQNLYGVNVKKGSSLYEYLSTRNDIVLEDGKYSYAKVRGRGWLDLEFAAVHHRQQIKNDELREYLVFEISTTDKNGVPECVYKEKLTINESWFQNLITSPNAQKYRKSERNQRLLQIAAEELPELP